MLPLPLGFVWPRDWHRGSLVSGWVQHAFLSPPPSPPQEPESHLHQQLWRADVQWKLKSCLGWLCALHLECSVEGNIAVAKQPYIYIYKKGTHYKQLCLKEEAAFSVTKLEIGETFSQHFDRMLQLSQKWKWKRRQIVSQSQFGDRDPYFHSCMSQRWSH